MKKKNVRITLLIFVFSLCAIINIYAEIEFNRHNIVSTFNGASSVLAIDIDSDGDIDIVGSAYVDDEIKWWENDGNQDFDSHTITSDFDGAWFVDAADVDSDDDTDIIAAAEDGDEISWWENDGGDGLEWIEHEITTGYDYAQCVYAVDLDNDDDTDIVSVARYGFGINNGNITWWENDGNEEFTEHLVSDDYDHARFASAIDFDNDDDIDILAAGGDDNDHRASWFENNGEQVFEEHLIDESLRTLKALSAVDIDDDDDLDVLIASYGDNEIALFENLGDDGFNGITIADNFSGAYAVCAEDIDVDGDYEIFGAAWSGNKISLWDNDGEGEYDEQIIEGNFNGAKSVIVNDLDSDGDLDVIGAARHGNTIDWWENATSHRPDPFSLMSPVDGSVLTELPVTFEWEAAEDPDLNDVITYVLLVATDEDFTVPIEFDADTSTTLDVDDLLDFIPYWWKVIAYDQDFNSTWSSETWEFTLILPMLQPHSLAAELNDVTGEVNLSWEVNSFEGDIVELVYDDSVHTRYFIAEDIVSVASRMTPEEPCRLLSLKYFISNPEQRAVFRASVYTWDGMRPGSQPIFSSMITNIDVPEFTWIEIDVSDEYMTLDQDFCVGFEFLQDDIQLGAGNGINDRGWFYEDNSWTFFRSTLFIRAVVQYMSDEVSELSNSSRELDELIHYKIYRDEIEIIRTNETTATDQLEETGTYSYTVSALYDQGETNPAGPVIVGWTDVDRDERKNLPLDWSIYSLHPNPFNNSINIRVSLPQSAMLKVSIYNILGNEIIQIVNQKYNAGLHTFTFNSTGLSSGIYIANAFVPNKLNESKKIVLMK
ncbi:MAG: T9SS type A sorting domain-containing protein [Candidatus Electryonea clarkiae]|nr:T9SS type A sorting domain-containing protein [Candidatus Electryonea clarkiae]MDP8286166.1 T9SS type A sorting domain-containing protein [Candidatus Electryonea clarkiae]